MKLNSIGLGVLILGLLIVVYALLFMEVSIDGEYVSADLLNRRLIWVIIGSFAILLGALVLLATKLTGRNPETVGGDAIETAKRSADGAVDAIKNYGVSGAVRRGPLVVGVIGFVLVCEFLFSPVEDASPAQVWIGLLLVVVAIYLNRGALSPKTIGVRHKKKRLKWHLIAAVLLMLVGVFFALAPFLLMYEGDFSPNLQLQAVEGILFFLLGIFYLIGASIWVRWFNRNIEK